MLPSLSSPLHLRVGLGFALWAGKRVMQQLPERNHTQWVSCCAQEEEKKERKKKWPHLDLIGSDGGGEDNVEFKDQEALVERPLVGGHSFSGNLLHVAWADGR